MNNPATNPVFSITFHNPAGGNIVMFVMLQPADPTGAPTNQPFTLKADSGGNIIETDPAGNPMAQDKNAGYPKSVGSYSYSGTHLKMYMVSVTSHAPLLTLNGSFRFDGYLMDFSKSIFNGNLEALLLRGIMNYGPGTQWQGNNYFLLNGNCTIAPAPPVHT